MSEQAARPSILLDVDDVLCPGSPYGGHHVYESFRYPAHRPSDLYSRLFSAQAVEVLNELLDEFAARFVLTTSWLSLLDRPQFVHVFEQCGLPRVAEGFHRHWAAPTNRGESRLDAILRWLRAHHDGEPFVVLDDVESGQSLAGSTLEAAGRVVLCAATGCLQPSHRQLARQALRWPLYEPNLRAPSRN